MRPLRTPNAPRPRTLRLSLTLTVSALLAMALAAPPVGGAGPTAETAAELLARTRGGSAGDYRLVYQRNVPGGGWVGKFLDARGSVAAVYRDAAGALSASDPFDRAPAAGNAVPALERKADAALRRAVATSPATRTLPVAVWLDADAATAETAVVASHPEVRWIGDRPMANDLGTMRALRAELWRARRVAYDVVQQAVAAGIRSLGGRVAYASTSAPMLFVDLPAGRVSALAGLPRVRSIGLEQTWAPAMSTAAPTVDANWTSSTADQGTGVRYAVVEYHNVHGSGDLAGKVVASHSTSGTLAYVPSGGFDHPTWVAGAVAGQNATYRGVAPGALIVSSGTGGYSASLTYDRAVIAAADWAAAPSGGDADIINTSLVQDTATGAEEARRYFDSVVDEDGRFAVSAAGNYVNAASWVVGSPGTGWNVMTVGGTDDRNTASRGDDRIWYVPGSNGSCYLDPSGTSWNAHGDFNKPNLSAPAVSVRTANGLAASGTSVATPIVGGIAAQLMARAPSLLAWPEAVRALLMAGAFRQVHMPDGSVNRDHQGVGLPSALWSNRILNAGDGHYGGYVVGSTDATAGVEQAISVVAGQRVRVALSWNSHTSGTSNTGKADALRTDFDLQVIQPNGALVGSYSVDNNYEVLDFTAPSSGTARIRLAKTRFDAPSEQYALAWSKVSMGTPSRIAGSDRYATSAAVSRASFGAGVPVAFVATGTSFADALAGGPAAGVAGGPVLLTTPLALPTVTANELSRLRPARIYVLGGTGVVSQAVASKLASYTSGPVTRLGGADRFATAAAIARTFFAPGAAAAFVATGAGYADALSAGPAAVLSRGPVLLTAADRVPAATADALRALAPRQVYVVGGSAAISSSVAQQLGSAAGAPVKRISGSDRYATSAAISASFFSTPARAYLASGGNFPDALSGAPVAGLARSPLLLVARTSIPAAVVNELRRIWPPRTVVLGGSAIVSDQVVNQLRSLLGNQ